MISSRAAGRALPAAIAIVALGYAAIVFFVQTEHYWSYVRFSGPHRWLTADWLINYSAGFVRRGLTGELALRLDGLVGTPARFWISIVFVQLACYASFYGFAALLFARAARPLSWPSAFAFFSPAFLLFPVLCFACGYRKEILHFALFAVLCWRISKPTPARSAAFFAAACVCFVPLFILSHEMLILAVPFYLVAGGYLFAPGRARASLIWGGMFVVACGAAFFAALAHAGTSAQAEHICRSLIAHKLDRDVCTGAINWLPKTNATGHAAVVAMVAQPGFTVDTLLAVLLAFAPLVVCAVRLARHSETRASAWAVGAAFALSSMLALPVLWVAMDWGRVLHFEVVSTTLLLFALSARASTPSAEPIGLPRVSWALVGIVVALVAYHCGWSLRQYLDPLMPGYGWRPLVTKRWPNPDRIGRPFWEIAGQVVRRIGSTGASPASPDRQRASPPRRSPADAAN
jgi:hypothetical protein